MRNESLANDISDNQQLANDFKPIGHQETTSYNYGKEDYSRHSTLSYKGLSDGELIQQYVRRENEDAFNEIVNRYGWKIHRLAFRITHDMATADDIMQEVFMVLFQKLDTLREDAKFSTWLYKIATNMSFMFLRKQNRQRYETSLESYISYDKNGYFEGVELEDRSYLPENMLIRKETKEQIEKALTEMSEMYRIVFHLSELEGLTNADIAEVLGLTLPAVKSRLRRAKLFMRDRIRNNEDMKR